MKTETWSKRHHCLWSFSCKDQNVRKLRSFVLSPRSAGDTWEGTGISTNEQMVSGIWKQHFQWRCEKMITLMMFMQGKMIAASAPPHSECTLSLHISCSWSARKPPVVDCCYYFSGWSHHFSLIMNHRFLADRTVNGVSNGLCCPVLVISVRHLEYHHDGDGDGDGVGDGDGDDVMMMICSTGTGTQSIWATASGISFSTGLHSSQVTLISKNLFMKIDTIFRDFARST